MAVLQLRGVDTNTFNGHSTRSASSSNSKEVGGRTVKMLNRGIWSNSSTFERFYHKKNHFRFQTSHGV